MDDILKRLEKLENITSFEYFTGIGFDSHKFDPSKMGIVLGGVNIPYEKGFYAHSDGDVVYHALAESILGALALGDLGTHFPDSDDKYKDIDSSLLVKEVVSLMKKEGYEIGNIDISITLEKPKLKDYILQMRQNIASLLETDIKNVSVKAGTNEKLDEIGKGLAVKAESIVLLQEKE